MPASFLNALKALAHAEPEGPTSSLDSLKLDLLELIQDEQGETVQRITLHPPADGITLTVEERRVWKVKEGLSEHEDFQFIAEAGWELMRTW